MTEDIFIAPQLSDFEKSVVGLGTLQELSSSILPKMFPNEAPTEEKAKNVLEKLALIKALSKVGNVYVAAPLGRLAIGKPAGARILIEDSDDITPAVKEFLRANPIYYDENGLWWRWDGASMAWEKTDETTLMGMFEAEIENEIDFAKSSFQSTALNRMRLDSRRLKPAQPNGHEVQFGRKIYDIRSGEAREPSPKLFFVNVLPHGFPAEGSEETPTIDRLFEEWVGKDQSIKLLELCAYSCLPDYPMQVIFALIGGGNNGKTTFLNFLKRFIGQRNAVSARLDGLVQSGGRFESAVLYRKLVCTMGETNCGLVRNTSYLKDLSGGDDVVFEFKGKTPFTARNYAKIIIASNALPATTDKTRGYLRRWLIIDFPFNFDGKEKRYPLDEIPAEEWPAFSRKCLRVLGELLKRGHFTGEGTIEERIKRYEDASNPMLAFMKENFEEIPDYSESYPFSQFCTEYKDYCTVNHRRVSSAIEVGRMLRAEGWEVEHQNIPRESGEGYSTIRAIIGLKKLSKEGNNTHITHSPPIAQLFEKYNDRGKKGIMSDKEFSGLCASCGETRILSLDAEGQGVCRECREENAQ